MKIIYIILALLQTTYFFNPLIWYAFRKIHEDCEVACDGMALNYISDEEHQQYGNTIIKLIRFFSERNFIPVTAGIGKSKYNYKRRIVMVNKYRKSKWTNILLSVILICFLGTVGLTGCNLVKKDDGGSNIPKGIDSSENPTQTPESTNPSKTTPEESTKENEEQVQAKYFGDWVINKVIAFGVGTYSEEDANTLIGLDMTFTKDTASTFGDQLADAGSTIENPRYAQTVMTEDEFLADYKISLSLLGIESNTATVINVSPINISNTDYIVSTFLVKDDNTLILFGGGTYFELIPKGTYESDEEDTESSRSTEGAEYIGNTPLGVSLYGGNVEGDSIEYIYISSKIGWKAELNAEGMFKESITLYKTEDGGKNWNRLTSTEDKNATIPLASKTGIIFTDSDHGWITTLIPKSGYIGLYRTTDGGVTWEEQDLTVPDKYSESEFTTYPPIFFTNKDGLLLSYGFDSKTNQLVYVTHDGGDTWKQIGEQEDTIFQWSYTEQENTEQASGWSISYDNKKWTTTDTLIWNESNGNN